MYHKYEASRPNGKSLCDRDFVIEFSPTDKDRPLRCLKIKTYASVKLMTEREKIDELCRLCLQQAQYSTRSEWEIW